MIHSMMDSEIWKREFELMVDQEHFEKVWDIINTSFNESVDSYLDNIVYTNPAIKPKDTLSLYIKKLIDEHSKGQEKNAELFHSDNMAEYQYDMDGFKGDTLSKKCPAIRVALMSRVEALKDWRIAFKVVSPQKLYDTFYNMISFAEEYKDTMTEDVIEKINTIDDNGLIQLAEDFCYLTGVIGTGILSNILNSIYPWLFPGMFKFGTFALYILSGRQAIDMGSNSSEFLMIKDDIRSKTGIIEADHNYFFPYETFALYTLRIYRALDKAINDRFQIKFPDDYRYVLTNDFYRYIVDINKERIQTLLGNDDILKFQISV
ncbi:MAG TPA: hypothetical protein DIW17_09310 [Clostridiales bacterium]|nr:hypothetical protein [Clostridiales bacterium]